MDPKRKRAPEDYLLDQRQWRLALGSVLAGLLLLVCFQTDEFGYQQGYLGFSREEAVTKATSFCRQQGLEVQGLEQTVFLNSELWSEDYHYLLSRVDLNEANALVAAVVVPWRWKVRWVPKGSTLLAGGHGETAVPQVEEASQDTEFISVDIDATSGKVVAFGHQIPNHWPGAQIAAGSARKLVQEAMAAQFSLAVGDPDRYVMVLDSTVQQQGRTDHFFAWELVDARTKGGQIRAEGSLLGDQLGSVFQEYRAPGTFRKQSVDQEHHDTYWDDIPIAIVGITMVLGAIFLFKAWHRQDLQWAFPLRMGALTAALVAIRIAESAAEGRSFELTDALLLLVGLSLGVVVGVAVGTVLFLEVYPLGVPPNCWFAALGRRSGSTRFWGHTLLVAAALGMVFRGVDQSITYFEVHVLGNYYSIPHFDLGLADQHYPFVNPMTYAGAGIVFPYLVMAFFLVWERTLARIWAVLAVMGVTYLANLYGHLSPELEHQFYYYLLQALNVGIVLLLAKRLNGANLMVYMVYIWSASLIEPGWLMVNAAHPFFMLNGLFLLVLAGIPLLLPLLSLRVPGGPRHS